MSLIIVDVEADGSIPAEFPMVCFGAVLFDDHLDKSFYGRTRSISDRFLPEALAVSGFSWEGTINRLDHPALTWELIKEAAEICASLGRKHNYRFNGTSNFTHPQFPGLWADINGISASRRRSVADDSRNQTQQPRE